MHLVKIKMRQLLPCLTYSTGLGAEHMDFSQAATGGAANDELSFQEKQCEIVHHPSPHWPPSLLPSHSASPLFFLSLFSLIT